MSEEQKMTTNKGKIKNWFKRNEFWLWTGWAAIAVAVNAWAVITNIQRGSGWAWVSVVLALMCAVLGVWYGWIAVQRRKNRFLEARSDNLVNQAMDILTVKEGLSIEELNDIDRNYIRPAFDALSQRDYRLFPWSRR